MKGTDNETGWLAGASSTRIRLPPEEEAKTRRPFESENAHTHKEYTTKRECCCCPHNTTNTFAAITAKSKKEGKEKEDEKEEEKKLAPKQERERKKEADRHARSK